MSFKVGDKVRCIHGATPAGLVEGDIYTVDGVDGTFVCLAGDFRGVRWYPGRFERVAAASKIKPSLIPADALLAVAGLLTTAGAGKHSDEKWRTMTVQEHLDAAMRHILKRGAGETIDPEYGTDHAVHAAARILFAVALLVKR